MALDAAPLVMNFQEVNLEKAVEAHTPAEEWTQPIGSTDLSLQPSTS
jgi:hypothetical protein